MEINLQNIRAGDMSVLRNLLELYLYDLSEFDGEDVNEHGYYGYNRLDHYWTEPGRSVFFIRFNRKLAGFSLVRDIADEKCGVIHILSEFFVMRKYRRMKVGVTAARLTFDLFPGRWRVTELPNNLPAQLFWQKVISAYTNGHYCNVTLSDWDGPVQEFSVPTDPKDCAQPAVLSYP